MPEKYSRLYSLENNLYLRDCPVIIMAGALLKDNQSGKALAQLKFVNISNANIKAVKIKINAFDITGNIIDGVNDYQYLDLNVKRNDQFGQNSAIILPNNTTRSFAVRVSTVVFEDGTTWIPKNDLPLKPTLINQLIDKLGDEEFASQYSRDTTSKARYCPIEINEVWMCTCGTFNYSVETKCFVCGLEKDKAFSALDKDKLKTNLGIYKEKLNFEDEEKKLLIAKQEKQLAYYKAKERKKQK